MPKDILVRDSAPLIPYYVHVVNRGDEVFIYTQHFTATDLLDLENQIVNKWSYYVKHYWNDRYPDLDSWCENRGGIDGEPVWSFAYFHNNKWYTGIPGKEDLLNTVFTHVVHSIFGVTTKSDEVDDDVFDDVFDDEDEQVDAEDLGEDL
jgi:hypothetical protein